MAWVCSWCGRPDPDWLTSLTGVGTALKPAVEPIILARKLLIGTVAENVLAYGTGALNIDATRIATGGLRPYPELDRKPDEDDEAILGAGMHGSKAGEPTSMGRWPSNLVLVHHESCRPTDSTREVKSATHYPAARGRGGIGNDGHAGQDDLDEVSLRTEAIEEWVCVPGCPVAALDQQSGEVASTGTPDRPAKPGVATTGGYGGALGLDTQGPLYSDTGGASRFFARFAEGIDEQIERDGPVRYVAKAPGKERPSYIDADGNRIVHSTVKPLALVRYLIRLITPPGGTVLDPFTGSGTTAEAAVLEGARFIGCELTAEYLPLIDQRIARGYRGGPDYPDPVAPPARPVADDGLMSLFDDF